MLRSLGIAAAVVGTVLILYTFSFQRFTLAYARRRTQDRREIYALQLLMTPNAMGAVGWIATFLGYGAAALLWYAYSWKVAVAYLAARFVVVPILPLLPLTGHFTSLSTRELGRHQLGSGKQIVSALLAELAANRSDDGWRRDFGRRTP